MAENIPEGDYEKGKKIFKARCFQCHVRFILILSNIMGTCLDLMLVQVLNDFSGSLLLSLKGAGCFVG